MSSQAKIFGIGLPRSGTTSLSFAALQLGYKTCHAITMPETIERAEALFDTPIWADYQELDRRYPGSKFILSWRHPEAWQRSFVRNLGPYLKMLRDPKSFVLEIDRRSYLKIFGSENDSTPEHLLACYRQHRAEAERYFASRPEDLLILPLDDMPDPWEPLCRFLGRNRPDMEFPRSNSSGMVHAWLKTLHPLMIVDPMHPHWLKWTQDNLQRGVKPEEIVSVLMGKNLALKAISEAMGDKFPVQTPANPAKA